MQLAVLFITSSEQWLQYNRNWALVHADSEFVSSDE